MQPIPLSTPDLRGREIDYLRACITDNWVSSAGPFVTEMEKRVAVLCRTPHAIATVNGTTALQLALLATRIAPGDIVLVPDWTFAATVNATVHAGARPVLVDVSEVNLTISPDHVEKAFQSYGDRIHAVVAVHVLGRTPDLKGLTELCRKHNAILIEDAAGAFGARSRGRASGTSGAAGVFSFNGNKIATSGSGGMIVTHDDAIARRARHLSQQARVGDEYRHDAIGFNFRMSNISAAVGLAQLERFDEMKSRRLEIQHRYDDALFPSAQLRKLPLAPWDEPYCWLYSVRCTDANSARSLVQWLRRENIEARCFWVALGDQEPYSRFERFGGETAKAVSGSIVSLPCSSHLVDADQDRVIAAIKDWEDAAT